MKLLTSILFGILGLFIGYLIPWLSKKIMEYKKLNIKTEKNLIVDKYLKAIMCLFNGAAWYYTFSSNDSIIIASLVSIQITMGIIFAFIDIKTRIIPNELVLTLLAVGIMFQTISYGLYGIMGSLMSMIFIMIIFTAVACFMGLGKVGAGDVKLAGAIGFALGYPAIITAMGAMAIILILYIMVGLALKKIQMTTMLPLAPFLTSGYILTLVTLIN